MWSVWLYAVDWSFRDFSMAVPSSSNRCAVPPQVLRHALPLKMKFATFYPLNPIWNQFFLTGQKALVPLLWNWTLHARFIIRWDTRLQTDGDLLIPIRKLSTAALSKVTVLALKGMHDRIPLRSLIPYLNSLRVLRLMGFGDWVRRFSFFKIVNQMLIRGIVGNGWSGKQSSKVLKASYICLVIRKFSPLIF